MASQLMSFFNLFFCCQVCGTRRTHVLQGSTLYKKKEEGSYLVSGETQEGYSMWPVTLRWILSEPYVLREEEKFDKSISTPKLSALQLQHRCLRFLLLLKMDINDYCEQRYTIVLIKDDFLNQILEEHKSKRQWICKTKPVPVDPKHLIYLSICWCKALSSCLNSSCHCFYPPLPSLSSHFCVVMWLKTLSSCL